MSDNNEVLIYEVQKNPILFDKANTSYKDTKRKKDVWRQIGERVGVDGKIQFLYIAFLYIKCLY